MADIFQNSEDDEDVARYLTAKKIKSVGRILMSICLRAAGMYYHVSKNGPDRIYPGSFLRNSLLFTIILICRDFH